MIIYFFEKKKKEKRKVIGDWLGGCECEDGCIYRRCAHYAPRNSTHSLTELPFPSLSPVDSLSKRISLSLSLFFAFFLFSSLQSQECFSELFPPPTLAFFPSISLSLSHANIHTPSPGQQHPGPPSFILSAVSSILESNLLLISHLNYGTCRSRRYYREVTCRQSQTGEASAAFRG